MGRFADGLSHRIRARKLARGIRHPASAGVVMWCPRCRAQMLSMPPGKAPNMRAQRNAVVAHERVCTMRDVRMMPLVPIRNHAIARAFNWRRRWPLLAAFIAAAVALGWLIAR